MKLHHKIAEIGTGVTIIAMISSVTIQVFARLFLESAPPWTEEAARIFFIYAVAFGVGIGIRNGDFIKLDVIDKYLNPHNVKILQMFSYFIVVIFSIIFIVYALQFVKLGLDEKSPALRISMGLIFASMVITGLSTTIFTIEELLDYTQKNKKK